MLDNNTLENEFVTPEINEEESSSLQEEINDEDVLALPEVITSGDEYPSSPEKIFFNSGDESFVQLTQVFKRQIRDYKFFLKFQKYVPVTHFSERPERSPHTYEKQYWNLTLFNRFCCALRKKAKPLNTSPFSPSGDYAMFEKEILYSPQKCPVYVYRSRAIMESNLKRFKRVLYTTHRDVYNSESLMGYISEDESSIKLGRFVKSKKSDDSLNGVEGQEMSLISHEEHLQTELDSSASLE